MTKGYRFTRAAAARIVKAVRRIEQLPDVDGPAGFTELGTLGLQFRRFELLTELTPGGTATAALVRRIGGQLRLIESTQFTVADFTGRFKGRARGSKPPPDDQGSRGIAIKLPDERPWQIVMLDSAIGQQARWIRFSLSENLGWQSSAAQATVLQYWDGDDPGEQVVVLNCAASGDHYLFAGSAGAIGLACYDPQQDKYRIVQLECP